MLHLIAPAIEVVPRNFVVVVEVEMSLVVFVNLFVVVLKEVERIGVVLDLIEGEEETRDLVGVEAEDLFCEVLEMACEVRVAAGFVCDVPAIDETIEVCEDFGFFEEEVVRIDVTEMATPVMDDEVEKKVFPCSPTACASKLVEFSPPVVPFLPAAPTTSFAECFLAAIATPTPSPTNRATKQTPAKIQVCFLNQLRILFLRPLLPLVARINGSSPDHLDPNPVDSGLLKSEGKSREGK